MIVRDVIHDPFSDLNFQADYADTMRWLRGLPKSCQRDRAVQVLRERLFRENESKQRLSVAELFIANNVKWLDEVAEGNDHFGTLQGVAIAGSQAQGMQLVQLVFEHGIVEADLHSLELVASRVITRVDEL